MSETVETPSASAPGTVATVARRMAGLSGQSSAFAQRARRLAERSAAQRYHIAVLGEFKRGKSTLVNALIGRPALPSGVVPVTTVATEVHFGEPQDRAVAVLEDGTTRAIASSEVATYVSERDNPGNRLGARRVEVYVREPLGAPGVVLVDTPGVASLSARQTRAAWEALSDSDGAVVVLSVDAPLSESESGLVADLAERGGRVFVVVNKCDHLTGLELAEVRAFLTRHLDQLLGEAATVYFLSARRALESVTGADAGERSLGGDGAGARPLGGDGAGGQPGDPGFDAFRRDLEAFLRDDLAAERDRANAAELDRLAASLSETVAIERAAAAMDLAVLGDRLERFRTAADDVRRAFAEDRLVLDHDVAQIGEAVAAALVAGAADSAGQAWPRVEELVAGLRGRALDVALDKAVAAAVEEAFDPLRHAVEATADHGWEEAAARFADRLRRHVQALRTAANALFDVHLPEPVLPTVAEQRERFSYLFLQVESPGSSLARTLRTALPTARARHSMLDRARRHLVSELDKHAGRARFDVVQRLDAVSRRFVTAMADELEQTEASIVAAATSAQRELTSSESEQAEREVAREVALSVAAEAGRLTGRARSAPPR